MAVPPLHEGVLHARVGRVAFGPGNRQGGVVAQVEHGHRDDGGDVEPNRHVQVPFPASGQGAKEVHGEDHPDQHDRQVDGPLQLGVFLGLGDAQGQRDSRRHDDQLPSPKVDRAEQVAEHARLYQTLGGVIDRRKDAVAGKGEDHRVGVQGAQPAKGEPGKAQVHGGQGELQGADQPHQHSNQAPYHGGQGKFAHDAIVVMEGFHPGGGCAGRRIRHFCVP